MAAVATARTVRPRATWAAGDGTPSDLPGAVDAPHAQEATEGEPTTHESPVFATTADAQPGDADGGERPAREGGRRRRGGRGRGSRENGAGDGVAMADGGDGSMPEPGFARDATHDAHESHGSPDRDGSQADAAPSVAHDAPMRHEPHPDEARSVVEPAATDIGDDVDAMPAPVAAPAPTPAAERPPRRERPRAEAPPEPKPDMTAAPTVAAVSHDVPDDYEMPLASLQSVAESAGLQWVGSDPQKIEAAQAALAAEPAPARVVREAKPQAQVDDGPLVLVETKKDLSQVRLPFENTPPASS